MDLKQAYFRVDTKSCLAEISLQQKYYLIINYIEEHHVYGLTGCT